MASMACEMGECGHIDRCIPDPSRDYRGWCPYCERGVYGDQSHIIEQRTNGVTTQKVPAHIECVAADDADLEIEAWRENAEAFYRQLDDLGY